MFDSLFVVNCICLRITWTSARWIQEGNVIENLAIEVEAMIPIVLYNLRAFSFFQFLHNNNINCVRSLVELYNVIISK